MSVQVNDGYRALTDKEKQTLRLIAHGHDAKSSARSLGLSVHTINERLREARRKMAVSSSREAARLLLQTEGNGAAGAIPQLSVPNEIGEDFAAPPTDQEGALPVGGVRRPTRRPLIIGGFLMMLVVGLTALMFAADLAPQSAAGDAGATAAATSEAATTARQFLTLLDESRWDESYQYTGKQFREQNSLQLWTSVSEKVRKPLGAATSRTFLSQDNFPAPPDGYDVVKFRTSFAGKPDAIETVTLSRENGAWRVAAVIIS
ncbi:DUF4019 domain-containing protein [Sphingoaurantiacus capsulatus]|uniref:DUF4019 domain-containing protein n=1 Tax=Sphingoaurantiacus capsulatus TaxID=1771310 RepID=A0ABV7X5L0_9SPHN